MELDRISEYFLTDDKWAIDTSLMPHVCFIAWPYFDGLKQDCCNSIANALELLQSCLYGFHWFDHQRADCGSYRSPVSYYQSAIMDVSET